MATIEVRGYANKVEHKTSASGSGYVKFTLAVQQKRKVKGEEVKEKLYFNCVDFDGKDAPSEGDYVGVTGYITISNWAKDGKGGANLDVTVKSYEKLEQRGGNGGTKGNRSPNAGTYEPPADPFDLGDA